MRTPASAELDLDRATLLDRFERVRRRSRELFGLLSDEAYYERPIALRNPIVFYEGHLAAFSVNTLLKKALGQPGIDADLETLFARGIDPEQEAPDASTRAQWPSRDRVLSYVEASDGRLREALATASLSVPGHALLDRGEAVFAILEHEEMHQETLQYIWHRLPFEHKQRPAGVRPHVEGSRIEREMVRVPAGVVTLGANRDRVPFGWDNEFPEHRVDVQEFSVDRHDVTNADYLAFVEDGGYAREDLWDRDAWAWRAAAGAGQPLFWERHDGGWYWRAMFELVPLPASWPAYVSHAEASAYVRWRGCRLLSEPEFHRVAYGSPDGHERAHPWGDEPPSEAHGNFGHQHWDPVPAGTRPAGTSAFGVADLVGNGWEWTSSPFRPFPGFTPMASYPEYSADFFDDRHYVLKGASAATPAAHVRRSFRNWFRPHYPYVYATFRCAHD